MMKIKIKKLPFTKKSIALMCFFACMFVFASFTKEDRQKVREWKRNLIGHSLKEIKDTVSLNGSNDKLMSSFLNVVTPLPNRNPEISVTSPQKGDSLNLNLKGKKENLNISTTQFSDEKIKVNDDVNDFPSTEREGTIGVFSDTEEDRVKDNFFTVILPDLKNNNSGIYLEYELYGLENHQSVSRSINRSVSVGGDIIVPSAEWSHQKEKINSASLKEGSNSIMFTSPSSGVKYKIKNLKITLENNKQQDRDSGISTFLSGDMLYVKGLSNSAVSVNGNSLVPVNGEFEKTVKLTETEKNSGKFSLTKNGVTEYLNLPKDEKSFKVIDNTVYSYHSITLTTGQEVDINYEDLNFKADKDVAESASLEILKLREKDLPAVSGGLKNVVNKASGFRLTLKSGKLNKKVKVTIPYDENKLGLINPREIKVFSFDYNRKQWKVESSSIVDTKTKTVTFEGDGDGDYINGVISLPESPQLNSFAPTTISGLKAANPVWAPLMDAPSANQNGDANINYPLMLPAGTQGMQPALSVDYSSGSGNGWLGEGWNVGGLSSIAVDMKWGTPGFSPGEETELYSFDGEMLVYPNGYLPHRHNTVNANGTFDTSRQSRNSNGVKTFYLRKNHDFTRIERFGSSPSNYSWIVTSTDGTKTYYGGDPFSNSVLKNHNGEILQWGIWKVEDVHGNNIMYEYRNESITNFTGNDVNLNNGKVFHVSSIFYSGRNGQKGPYRITFFNNTPRQDKTFSVKGVLKRIEPYLLSKIDIDYTGSGQAEPVRTYEFTYASGSYGKSIMTKMKLKTFDSARRGYLAFDYNFDYNFSSGFDSVQNVATPGTDAFSNVVTSITTPSVISSDSNFEWGWSARTGAGFSLFKPQTDGVRNFMITIFGGASYPRMKKAQELVDFNGDGVADILYRQRNSGNGIRLIPGSLDGNGNLVFNSGDQPVGNLNSNFYHTTGTTWNFGAMADFKWWKMGFDLSLINSESENETPVYMMDANFDGLPDVIKDDKVWFNRRNGNMQEMVITSDLTENMVITGNTPQPYTEPEDPDDEPVKPKNDVVKVWIAPKDGFISIRDMIQIESGQSSSAQAVYSIEIKNPDNSAKNCRLYLKQLIGTSGESILIDHYNQYPSTPLGTGNSSRLLVKSGEKVYFRLHKRTGDNNVVNTSPMVMYTDNSGSPLPQIHSEEQDGYMPNKTDYDSKFLLNNFTKTIKFTEAANIHINIPQFTISTLSDRVKYSIVLIKEDPNVSANQPAVILPVYEEIINPSNQPVNVSAVNLSYSVPAPVTNESWHLKFLVETDSHINKEIEWNDIEVSGYPDAGYTHYVVAHYPSYHIRYLKNRFDLSTLNNIPSGGDDYSISVNKNFTFSPSVPGRFMYVIKKKGLVLDKRIVEIANGALTEYTTDYNIINGIDPIQFFHGDPTSAPIDDSEKLNILVYCDTNKDRLAYESLKLQLTGNIFNIYNQSGNSLLNHTTETSVNTGEYNGISAIYHNWGQFLYNESLDIVPAAGSINQQPPITPGCEPKPGNPCVTPPTGPINSGPAYTVNTATPKDIYGALINDHTLENPFQFTTDFSACGTPSNSQSYLDCIGDVLSADFQNNYANTQLFGAASPFTALTPFKYRELENNRWLNNIFHEQYSKIGSFRDDETPTSPFIDTDPDAADIEVANNPNTKMFAITKKQKSKSKTRNWGIGFGLNYSNSTSQLRNIGNINTQDFFDVNGDNYPDILYRTQSQQTGILGGLKAGQGSIEGGNNVITNNSDFMNSSTIAFGPASSKLVGRTPGNKDSNATGDTSPPFSLNMGYSDYPNSYNKTTDYWMDINGDGLPDKMSGNNYKLNYGTGIVNANFQGSTGTFAGFEEPFSKPAGSASFNLGASLNSILDAVQGVNLGIAISGGIGAGTSTGNSKRSFIDVNGDGLVDIVMNESNGQTYVKYNLGNRFGDPSSLNASLINESATHSGYATLNGGYYVNIPAIMIFGIPILYVKPYGADLSANVGLSVTEINRALRDVNGDGFPDLVMDSGGSLKVYYSRAGYANKLKSVSYSESSSSNPTAYYGMAFKILYGLSRPSYDDPQAKVVMTEVEIPNPDAFSNTYTQSTNNKNTVTTFTYENSRYDRREREKYGFEKVTVREWLNNTNNYRTTVQTFYNQNYFVRGLLKSSYTYAGAGTSNLLASSENTYKLYKFNTAYTELIELSASEFLSYDTGGTEGRRMARVLPSGTVKNAFENGNSISVQNTLNYNNKGQLIKYQYTSPSTIYNSAITYHPVLNNNIQNIPSSITVYPGAGSTNPLRKRATEIYNINTGDIAKIKIWLNSSDIAETDLTYDAFGNIKTVKSPPNEFSQRSEIEYFYDPLGKYIQQVKDLIFNLSSYAIYDPKTDAMLQTTDAGGNIMNYGYDLYGRLNRIVGPKEIQAQTYTITYDYFNVPKTLANGSIVNLFGAKTKHRDPHHQNNDIETISFADITGEVVQVKKDIETLGQEKMSVSGKVVNDNLGRSLMQYHPSEESKNSVVNLKLSSGLALHVTSAEYDHKDRVIANIDEVGNSVENKYFIANNRVKTQVTQMQNSSVQIRTDVFANAEGKTVETINHVGQQPLTTVFEYNTVGELMSVKDPENLMTHFDYDMGGRRLYQSHPDRGETTYTYSKSGQLTHVRNNNLNNNGGVPIHYEYNYNRLVNIILPDIPSGSNPANVHYEYGSSGNAAGRIVEKQDGTGTSIYTYGNMGEVLNENRFIYGFYMPSLNFNTSYEYDSWNRIRNITYPDGEELTYQYDLGGNLKKIFNDANYEYVKSIKYDLYEQRTDILYGNDTSSGYSYEPAKRRLNKHVLLDENSNELLNGTYSYDLASNILSINNTSPTTYEGFGGNYNLNYGYDELNRLVSSSGNAEPGRKEGPPSNSNVNSIASMYNTELTYNLSSGIDIKRQHHEQDGVVNTDNSYRHQYYYLDGTHMVGKVMDQGTGLEEYYEYDPNGNAVKYFSSDGTIDDQNYWDEQDRLRAVRRNPQSTFHYYVYDDKGERTIKANLIMDAELYQNGELVDNGATFESYKVYPNPYAVYSSDGMLTKHYFAGDQRIASKIGDSGGMFNLRQAAPSTGKEGGNPQENAENDFKNYLSKAGYQTSDVEKEFAKNGQILTGVYYLHSDHLGTASYVTNEIADPTQFFLNLPFGETMVEQQEPTAYVNPYKFNAKELDSETGLYYYGARYYNPRISIWYGVDPLAVYNPVMETQFYGDGQHNGGVYNWGNLNPYIYTYQNPINYIDPNGKQTKSKAHNRGIGIPIPMYEHNGIYYPFPIYSEGELKEGFNRLQNDAKKLAILGITMVAIDKRDIWMPLIDGYNKLEKYNKKNNSEKLEPESGYLGSGKHGIKWKEGKAEAKKTRIPQGQWGSQEDLDYAGEKAASLKPREGKEFDLPADTKSVVHMPDGSTKKATKMWLRNNGSAGSKKTFHGYPK